MDFSRGTPLFSLILFLLGMIFGGWYLTNERKDEANAIPSFSSQSIDPETINRGHHLYERHCSTCHGPSGRGDGPASKSLNSPPANFRSDTVAQSPPKELFRTISKGKPRTGMPAWEGILSVSERKAIVYYLHREIMQYPEQP